MTKLTYTAKIDVKSKAPNGVAFNVTGTAQRDGPTSGLVWSMWLAILHCLTELADNDLNGQLEAKFADPSFGKPGSLRFTLEIPSTHPYGPPSFLFFMSPSRSAMLTKIRRAGMTLTQSWNTANILNTKLELDNSIAKGLKAEALTVRSHPHSMLC